jgi:glycosyltransferase involved in cell wall biosynthesis
VRALLRFFAEEGIDFRFFTTLSCERSSKFFSLLPQSFGRELARRSYDIPRARIESYPWREMGRLFLQKLGRPDKNDIFSVDAVYQDLDNRVAAKLQSKRGKPDLLYCYEDGACETFKAARELEIARCYDLPIAYWKVGHRLLEEEAERLPEWEQTLGAPSDSAEKLARKDEELDMASLVVCPSRFVFDTIPVAIRESRACIIAEFGSPIVNAIRPAESKGKLRVLFAGSMSQRKGLADVFQAMRLLKRTDVELVVMGSAVAPMAFYREQFPNFTYEPPRPHSEVLTLMQRCDILVLPSIVEGRALVQQEAMACGLPLIITANTGGSDLIEQGETGFLVPIRSPEVIAQKIDWFAENRSALPEMRRAAQTKAESYSWWAYAGKIWNACSNLRNRAHQLTTPMEALA